MLADDQEENASGEKDTNMLEDRVGHVGMIRPEMVDVARRFMMIPKIRQTPVIQQKRFLLQKGLREDEINEAMNSLRLQQDIWDINNTAMEHEVMLGSSCGLPTRSSGIHTWLRITKFAMIVTGFSYASWQLLRSCILPRFFNIREPADKRVDVIERKISEMQEMMGDVTTELLLKLQTVIDKQSIADRFTFQSASTLDDLKKNVETISAMVASKEQPLLVRPLAKKRSAMSSRARTEDPNRSDSSDNECLEEKSILLEKVGPREEHNGGMEAEKYNSDSDS